MFKTWTSSAADPEILARSLEAHLNEFAQDVVAISYAVTDRHYVLAVYTEVLPLDDVVEEEAVALAEQIIDGAGA